MYLQLGSVLLATQVLPTFESVTQLLQQLPWHLSPVAEAESAPEVSWEDGSVKC